MGLLTKADKKFKKSIRHVKHYYRIQRGIKKLAKIISIELRDKDLYMDIEDFNWHKNKTI